MDERWRGWPFFRRWIAGWVLLLGYATSGAAQEESPTRPLLTVPKLSGTPALEQFSSMAPAGEVERQMVKVTEFIQRQPADGEPATFRTEAYLGYTEDALHVVFVAFDPEPERVRAHRVRREQIWRVGDDSVDIRIDTFDDRRRSYYFVVNPLGVQTDALWPEAGGSYDDSFDAVWSSDGRLTDQGYIAILSVPFKSLRFPRQEEQQWGIILSRWIPRIDEWAFWPETSTRFQSYLQQSARMVGLQHVSPGRNVRWIPFVFSRAVESSARTGSEVEERDFSEVDVGLDAKVVLRDRFAVDLAVNPDFSQVESDDPQVTTNERFEVFFPEKRPFFLENAGLFETPINLVFSRRIADPRVGARVTGKAGRYNVGALVVDDEAPGRRLPVDDPLFGERAQFSILRLSRDWGAQSSVGLLATERRFGEGWNRTAGFDAALRFSDNWDGQMQAVLSATQTQSGERLDGSAIEAVVERDGRHLAYTGRYTDRSEGFRTEVGFDPRQGIRSTSHNLRYNFWPENRVRRLIPRVVTEYVWDREERLLDWSWRAGADAELQRQTSLGLFYRQSRVGLGPDGFPGAAGLETLDTHRWSARVSSDRYSQAGVRLNVHWGTNVNFFPAVGQAPEVGDEFRLDAELRLRPVSPLRFDWTYLLTELDAEAGSRVFSNEILRAVVAWQFTRELSARAIVQWETTDVDPERTTLEASDGLTGDILVTYLVNPWTALNVGYGDTERDTLGTGTVPPLFEERARQVFVKFSYLIQR